MIPEVSGMVPGVSRMVSGIYGRFRRLWKVPERKVMEGSGRVRDDPDYREKSGWFHNWCSHVSLKGKASFLKKQGRFREFNSDSEKKAVFG